MDKDILITICARGGSKGIPGKNTKILAGKPLIQYTFEIAKRFSNKYSADIQLSTDSNEIKNILQQFAYSTDYTRPAYLASDKAGKIDAIRDAWEYARVINERDYDYVLDLDVTSPLRTMEDVENAFKLLVERSDALNILSVSPAARNPYFNMVEETKHGFIKLVKEGYTFKSRQEAPLVYDMNASFYYFSRDFMLGDYTTSITKKSLIYVMPHVCFDLDHPTDFRIMELMIENNLLDFKL